MTPIEALRKIADLVKHVTPFDGANQYWGRLESIQQVISEHDREHAASTQPEPQVGDLWWVPGQPETVRYVVLRHDGRAGVEYWAFAADGVEQWDVLSEWQAWVASGAVLLWRGGA